MAFCRKRGYNLAAYTKKAYIGQKKEKKGPKKGPKKGRKKGRKDENTLHIFFDISTTSQKESIKGPNLTLSCQL